MRLWAVFLAASIAVLLVGCGQSEQVLTPERSSERTESARSEEATTEETTSAEESAAAQEASNTLCRGFGSQAQAQDYFDGPRPMPEERPQLDPDGNGVACDEPGNEAGVASAQPQYRTEPSAGGDQYGMLALANCQLAEAQASMNAQQFAAFQYELTDEMVAALEQDIDTNIQTLLVERGYTCDGTAEEVIEKYNEAR